MTDKLYNSQLFTLCMLDIFSCYLSSDDFFFIKNKFTKKSSFMNTIRVSNGLVLDQDQLSVSPYLGQSA